MAPVGTGFTTTGTTPPLDVILTATGGPPRPQLGPGLTATTGGRAGAACPGTTRVGRAPRGAGAGRTSNVVMRTRVVWPVTWFLCTKRARSTVYWVCPRLKVCSFRPTAAAEDRAEATTGSIWYQLPATSYSHLSIITPPEGFGGGAWSSSSFRCP